MSLRGFLRSLLLKYDRPALVNVIPPQTPVDNQDNPNAPDWSGTRLVVFGDWGQYHFKGYDSIVVTNKGYTPPPPDVTPPAMESDPVTGSIGVSRDVSPILTFTEPVRFPGGERIMDSVLPSRIFLSDGNGMPVPFTATWDQNENQVQVSPTHRLEPGATYRLTVPAGTFVDLSGNANARYQTEWVTEASRPTLPPALPIPVIEPESSIVPSRPADTAPAPSYSPPAFYLPPEPELPEIYDNDHTALLSDEALKEAMNGMTDGEIQVSATKPTLVLSKSQLEKLAEQSYFTIMWPNAGITVKTSDLPVDADYIGWTAEIRPWPDARTEHSSEQWLDYSEIIHVEEGSGDDSFSPEVEVTRAELVAILSRIYPQTPTRDSQHFPDVSSDKWYADSVQTALQNGWVLGDEDGLFHPENAVSREELAVILLRVAQSRGIELASDTGAPSFMDMDDVSEWASDAVNRLTRAGILHGKKTNNGIFLDPRAPLTRAEAATLLNGLLLT